METRNPYLIQGPANISFSGGRTSAYMLRKILDAHGGTLPSDVHVLFADTGKERQETYDFVNECSKRWGVTVNWVAYPKGEHATPFDALLHSPRCGDFLPSPVARFCTSELKIRPMRDWMLARGHENWDNIVGIRADEPRRVSRIRGSEKKERWETILPLADAGVALGDVNGFWAKQDFDLNLLSHQGNCDLCFLKGRGKLVQIARERPDLAEWWNAHEKRIGATFRKDFSYAGIIAEARNQQMIEWDDEPLIDCLCGD